VNGPSDDYVFRELRAEGSVLTARPGSRLFLAHGYTFLEVKPGTTGHEVSLAIQRGVTVRGRVTNLDGQPAQNVVMVSRLTIDSQPGGGWSIIPLRPRRRVLRDGWFELHGIGREGEVPVYFFDAEHDLSAVVNVSAKRAGSEPVIVSLERCGTAKARFLGPDGKPVAGIRAGLLIVPPGLSTDAPAAGKAWPSADAIDPAEFRPRPYSRPTLPRSDTQGWFEYTGLIPGATYRLSETSATPAPPRAEFRRDFTVKPGETLLLGDILVAKPPEAR
jgi:hypothetical protein